MARPRRMLAVAVGAVSAVGAVTTVGAVASYGAVRSRPASASVASASKSASTTTTTTLVTGSPAAKILLAAAIAATKAQKGFTTLSVETSKNMVLSLDTASGTNRGWQTIKLKGAPDGPETLKVMVMGPTAYLLGNKAGLADYMRFTPAAAASEAGKWIGATSASSSKLETYFYQSLAAGLTVASAASELQLAGKLSLGPDTTVKGTKVHDIQMVLTHGTQTAHGNLYVRASGQPLPVYESIIASTGVRDQLTTSSWGQEPRVVVPKSFTPVELGWLSKAWGG